MNFRWTQIWPVILLLMAGFAHADEGGLDCTAQWKIKEDPGWKPVPVKKNIFVPPIGGEANLGFSKSTYRLQLKCSNPSDQISQSRLLFEYPLIDFVRWIQPDGEITSVGELENGNLGLSQGRFSSIPLIVGAKLTEEWNFELYNRGPAKFDFQVVEFDRWAQFISEDLITVAVFYGLLLALLLYHLFAFIILKDRLYLYFALYIFSAGCVHLWIHGIWSRWLLPNEPEWNQSIIGFFFPLNMLTSFLHARRLLRYKDLYPQLYKWSQRIVWTLFPGLVLGFYLPYLPKLLLNFYYLVIPNIFLLGSSFYVGIIRKNRVGQFFFGAYLTFVLSVFFYAMSAFSWIPSQFLAEHAIDFFTAFEFLLLATAILFRTRESEMEKAKVMNDQFELLRERDRMKLQTDLARRVAHDIQSPLTALEVYSKTQSQGSQLLESALERTKEIIKDLNQKNKAWQKSYSLKDLMLPVVSEKRASFGDSVSIEVQFVDGSENQTVVLEKSEFQRMFSNLLNNAVESPRSQGNSSRVEIRVHRFKETEIRVEIRDNGLGFPQKLLENNWQQPLTVGKTGGSGIGLYHAFHYTHQLGGRLTIRNDKGAVVTMTFPQDLAVTKN